VVGAGEEMTTNRPEENSGDRYVCNFIEKERERGGRGVETENRQRERRGRGKLVLEVRGGGYWGPDNI
jgi:hypothetical protein